MVRRSSSVGVSPDLDSAKSSSVRSRSASATTHRSSRSSSSGPRSAAHQTTAYKDTSASKPHRLFSLWELLVLELDLPHNVTSEEITTIEPEMHSYDELLNMVKIPFHLEKFMVLGLMICFNSFLTLFTLVPLKIVVQLLRTLLSFVGNINSSNNYHLVHQNLQWIKKDILTISMVGMALTLLSYSTLDISRMYHDIRGQAHIKLYVMFGVLEVTDRLLASLGQDMLNILYKLPRVSLIVSAVRFLVFYGLSVAYLACHGYVLIYQTVSLNVAANSYSNALLTLLLSNQFAELKSSVFKKFEREGLFQITIADLAERYQLSLMVGIIAIRNLLQLNIDQFGLIPYSWNSWNTWVGAIFGPGIIIIGSEIFVDWLKHCFISKFNKFKPLVYNNYIHVLSLDYLLASRTSANHTSVHELSDYIILMRRLGVPLLASIVCFLGMTIGDFKYLLVFPSTDSSFRAILSTSLLVLLVFFILVLIRVILGLIILKFSTHIKNEYRNHQLCLRLKAKKLADEKTKSDPGALGSNFHAKGTFSLLTSSLVPGEPVSQKSEITITDASDAYAKALVDSQFLPGIPNSELSTINPGTRQYLYDVGDKVKPNLEQTRNKKVIELSQEEEDPMHKVMRYEMASKRIW